MAGQETTNGADIGALRLTRKRGEAVVIGNIRIEVLEIRGNRVLLSFQAPKSTRIWREELLEGKTSAVNS